MQGEWRLVVIPIKSRDGWTSCRSLKCKEMEVYVAGCWLPSNNKPERDCIYPARLAAACRISFMLVQSKIENIDTKAGRAAARVVEPPR